MVRVSEPQHHLHFGPDIVGRGGVGAVLGIVVCLTVSLVSILWMPVAPLPVVTNKNISELCRMSPGGQQGPQLRSITLDTFFLSMVIRFFLAALVAQW